MKQDKFNDLSELSAKNFSNEPVEFEQELREPAEENIKENDDLSDAQLFKEYMESGKSESDLEQYQEESIPTSKKPNGNMADVLPPELSRPQKKSNKKVEQPANETEKENLPADEDDFEKIMNRSGFHFDEESGTLNF